MGTWVTSLLLSFLAVSLEHCSKNNRLVTRFSPILPIQSGGKPERQKLLNANELKCRWLVGGWFSLSYKFKANYCECFRNLAVQPVSFLSTAERCTFEATISVDSIHVDQLTRNPKEMVMFHFQYDCQLWEHFSSWSPRSVQVTGFQSKVPRYVYGCGASIVY